MAHKRLAAVSLWITFALAPCLSAGCAKATAVVPAPSLPPSYYNCIAAVPDDLLRAYFTHYFDPVLAAQNFNGKVFVFHGISINFYMLAQKDRNILDVGTIQCTGALDGSVAKLKEGDVIDIVGFNEGPSNDPAYSGWLTMTGCYFLKADSVALPAPGGGTMAPIY
jgi:hypothetical protein